MALGWMTVLKMVPWTDVIKNAPAVADGAKKLWKTVGKDTPAKASVSADAGSELLPEAQALGQLHAQVQALELTVAELHAQMRESSGLIKALADQNTQLVKRVEVNRRRVLVLAAVVLCLGVAGVVRLGGPLIG